MATTTPAKKSAGAAPDRRQGGAPAPRTSPLSRLLMVVGGLLVIFGVALYIDGSLFFVVLISCILGLSLVSIWRMIASLVGVSEEDDSLESAALRKRRELLSNRDIRAKIVDELDFDKALGRIAENDYQVLRAPAARDFLNAQEQVSNEERHYRDIVESELNARLRSEGIEPEAAEAQETPSRPEPKKDIKAKTKGKSRTPTCSSCLKDIEPDSTFCRFCGSRQGRA